MNKLLDLPGCTIHRVELAPDVATVHTVSRARPAACPICGYLSAHLHAYRTRILHDLPHGSRATRVHLRLRRLTCRNANCPRRTFIKPLARPYARRTD